MRVQAPPGVTVSIGERVGSATRAAATVVTGPDGTAAAPAALPWRCDRRRRPVVASGHTAEGVALAAQRTVTTGSCADRFDVQLRPRTAVRAGSPVRVRVRDRWKLATPDARVCLRAGGGERCETVALRAGGRAAAARLRPARAGRARVVVEAAGARLRRTLAVRRRDAPLRLLATGDSMIQIVDADLERRLGQRARVSSDARISTGVSKPAMLDWVAHAGRQARAHRPDVVAVFLGANDGFPIAGRPCCDEGWIAAYSARVHRMMAAYRRGGATRVLWLLLPTPRRAAFAQVFGGVNAAVRRAAATYDEDEVAVVDLVKVFTPGGRYRASIEGRVVRQADGVHLNVAGASIAAGEITRRLRADGLIG